MPVHQVDIAEFRADARATVEENAPAELVDMFPVPRLMEASMPPEPGEGAVVLGNTGRAFQRLRGTSNPMHHLRWYAATGGGQHFGLSWPDLLAEQGPLWLVQDERPEAVRG